MTLIEVVAAIALLATLLTLVTLAYSRHVRQVQQAQSRLEATAAADRLLEQWFLLSGEPPRTAEGTIADAALAWRTTVVDRPEAELLRGEVVRLELFEVESQRAGPIAVVEILVPENSETTRHRSQSRQAPL